jgi:hypothetical protein
MHDWTDFFVGELTAAAALAGLLFVAISVNQARILELGRMADRGLESFVVLFLAIVVTSAALVPGQPLRLLGGEILAASLAALVVVLRLQGLYMKHLDPVYRPKSRQMIWFTRLAIGVTLLAGLVVVARGDDAGIYLLPIGILLSFAAAGANAWVLLIEISR